MENLDLPESRRRGTSLPAEPPLVAVGRLLADADSNANAEQVLERDAEVSDRIAVIWGRLTLADRLAGSVGAQVTCEVLAGSRSVSVTGAIAGCGDSWLHVRTDTGSSYLNLPALVSVSGIGREVTGRGMVSGPDQSLAGRLGWTAVLRTLADDRQRITVTTVDGALRNGYVGRVGADHFDLVAATPTCLALAAVAVVRLGS
ncbi:MAG: hypothetical protein WCP28_13650 [Actinomycetes bacterium]